MKKFTSNFLTESNLSVFPFMGHTFDVISKKSCLPQGYKDFLLCFLLQGIKTFTFRSTIHLELISIYGLKYVSKLRLLYCKCFSTFKRPSFFSWIAFVPLSKSVIHSVCQRLDSGYFVLLIFVAIPQS